MGNAARILVIGEDTSGEETYSNALRACGWDSTSQSAGNAGNLNDAETRPDVVILNMLAAQADRDPADVLEFLSKLDHEEMGRRLPVIVLGEREGVHPKVKEAIDKAQIDDVLLTPVSEAQVCARVASLVRLNTMHEELVRRLNTSAKYGVDAPLDMAPPKTVNDATVLVVGATTDFPAIEQSLSKDATLVGALTAKTALDYMLRRDFDAVLVNLTDDVAPYLTLAHEARLHSPLYNTPIIMLMNEANTEDLDTMFAAGITEVVFRPIDNDELNRRTMSLVRELRFRDSLRRIYAQARHMATSDGLTGLYSKGFLLEHLRTMLTDSERAKSPLSVAFFDIRNIEHINTEFGYVIGDRIIRQVGEMMGILVRGEDLTARYSGGRFVVALPDTPPDYAEVALKRINGVVNFTEFSVPDFSEPIRVEFVAGITGSEAGDTPEAIVERSRHICLNPRG